MKTDTKNRIMGLAALYLLIPAMLLAQPAGKKQLVGVWAVREAQVGQSQPPVLSLASFRGDGSCINCVGYKALPAIAALQEVATELGQYAGRAKADFLDAKWSVFFSTTSDLNGT